MAITCAISKFLSTLCFYCCCLVRVEDNGGIGCFVLVELVEYGLHCINQASVAPCIKATAKEFFVYVLQYLLVVVRDAYRTNSVVVVEVLAKRCEPKVLVLCHCSKFFWAKAATNIEANPAVIANGERSV
jgi:hypothetical protein